MNNKDILYMNNKDIVYIILFVLAFAYIYRNNCSIKNSKIEHMAVNEEAMSTLASMYKSGTLKVSNLEVIGKSTLNGDVNIRGNNTIHGNNTVRGDMHIDNIIWVGRSGHKYSIHRDQSGHLLFGHAGKNIITFPKDIQGRLVTHNLHVHGNSNSHTLTTRHDANIKNLRVGNHFSIKKGDREHKPLLYDWGLFKVQHTKSTGDHHYHHGRQDFFHVNGGKGVQVWDPKGASSFLIRSKV